MTILTSLLTSILFSASGADLEDEIRRLEMRIESAEKAFQENENLRFRVERLESEIENAIDAEEIGAMLVFFIGVFCGVWAQNSGRNPWLWLILGIIFNVVALIVLCIKNSRDVFRARGEPLIGGSKS